jgi:hypothetical protein
MRTRIVIILFVFFSLAAKADYTYMPLSLLVAKAENCVIGTIVDLDINYFYLSKEKVIFGEADTGVIKILRFESWNCGRRYDEYKVGQREIVFFHKSNNEIAEFDYIGYGMGGEFELAIESDTSVKYQYRYNAFEHFNLNDFIQAIKDFKQVCESVNNVPKNISNPDSVIGIYGNKSAAHKYIFSPFCFTHQKTVLDEFEDNLNTRRGVISNKEADYMYEGYDNKLEIQIENEKFEDLILEVEDAKVRKEKDYFVVNPVGGWSRRWLYVKKIEQNDTITLFRKVFNVYPIPSPTVYINDRKKDTISWRYMRRAVPRMKYDLGGWNYNDYLSYKVLKFDVDIITADSTYTVNCKSESGSPELRQSSSVLKGGERVRFYNIVVLYPDGSIHNADAKTIYVIDE